MASLLLEVFMKKNCKKLVKKNLEQKKYLKEKVINCMSNGKGIIIHLIVGLMKKTLYKNESILFLNRLGILEEILTLKLICLIIQQKMI